MKLVPPLDPHRVVSGKEPPEPDSRLSAPRLTLDPAISIDGDTSGSQRASRNLLYYYAVPKTKRAADSSTSDRGGTLRRWIFPHKKNLWKFDRLFDHLQTSSTTKGRSAHLLPQPSSFFSLNSIASL